ncbi:ATP-binding protein [Stachybotrys elegans]|uniref:ATP-binding protein n=1 Tax=Stachybotrys elegans TaxID=80388 RepID=A0A8K0T3C2_9HYPO|nr:ATP-binding protein [Stachybotrys elegans]
MDTSPGRLLIQMSGPPGSGKSTMARMLQRSLGGLVIDHDVIRSSLLQDLDFDRAAKQAYALQWALAEEALKQGLNVFVDCVCNYQQVLDHGAALAERHGCTYWYVECRVDSIDVLDQRLRARKPMRCQRTSVDVFPDAAQDQRKGQDPRAMFTKWMEKPVRPDSNVIIVDSSGSLEDARDHILQSISNTREAPRASRQHLCN